MEKYRQVNELTALGFLINAMDGGGDREQAFPRSDAEDLSRGLRFIPGEVTIARRRGEQVVFIQSCDYPCCWYWQFLDGSRTYYWERWDYERLVGDSKVCPSCGNTHTSGGHIESQDL